MDSASVYDLELLVLEGTGGKTLATDHRGRCSALSSWTLLSPARVQPLYGAGRKESSGTGLRINLK